MGTRGRWFAGLGPFALAACVPTSEVGLPPLPAESTVVLAAFQSAQPPELIVLDAEHLDHQAFTLHRDSEVEALVYPCTFDESTLPHGRLADTQLLPFSPGIAAFALVSRSDGELAWEPRPTQLPPSRFDVEPTGCARFMPHVVTLTGSRTGSSRFAIPLDGERVLVGAVLSENYPAPNDRYDPFWVVTHEGATLVPDDVLPPQTPNRGGWRAPDGRVYLVGEDGQFVVGDLEHGFSSLPPMPIPTSSTSTACTLSEVWLDGPKDADDPLELFAVTNAPGFYHFDGSSWTNLAPDLHACKPTRGAGQVIWRAPGEAIAVVPTDVDLVRHVRAGRTFSDPLPDYLYHIELEALTVLPGVGTFTGGVLGMFVDQGGGYELVSGRALDHVAALGTLDGSVLCLCNELLTEVRIDGENCTENGFGAGRHVRAIIPWGPAERVIVANAAGDDTTVTWLTWERAPADACARRGSAQ